MRLVVLPLVLAVGLVFCEAHVVPSSDQRNLPCPEADDIAPCVCTVQLDSTMDLDCSDIASEAQLARIFAGHFPFKKFGKLIIDNNKHLNVLRINDLGDVSFQDIQITNGILQAVQEGVLSASFKTVERMAFYNNSISTFPFTELDQFTELKELYINDNNIQYFPVLKSFTLTSIVMSGNPMKYLPADAVKYLPKAVSINFDNTGITEILPGTFTGVPHLRDLFLRSNGIQHLPAGAIQLGGDAHSVSLHSNSIQSIEVGAVAGLGTGYLELYSNLLEELDEAVFKPILDEGTNINLRSNPLNCGCDIAWLIIDPLLMTQMNGGETCYDGELLTELDPHLFETNC